MEIRTTYPKPEALLTPVTSPDQKKLTISDSDAEKNKPVTGDAVTLSKEALKLSQSLTPQDDVKPVQIESLDQAKKIADQLNSGIRNNLGQAQQAFGNIFQVNFKPLLG
jgi:hypothetical protein